MAKEHSWVTGSTQDLWWIRWSGKSHWYLSHAHKLSSCLPIHLRFPLWFSQWLASKIGPQWWWRCLRLEQSRHWHYQMCMLKCCNHYYSSFLKKQWLKLRRVNPSQWTISNRLDMYYSSSKSLGNTLYWLWRSEWFLAPRLMAISGKWVQYSCQTIQLPSQEPEPLLQIRSLPE